MSARVVHVRDNVPGAVYIGRANGRAGLRASPWANPHKVKDYGDRSLAIIAYTNDLRFGTRRPMLVDLPTLRDKPLACWCRREGEERTTANACHGDVLVKFLELHTDDELRELGKGQAGS